MKQALLSKAMAFTLCCGVVVAASAQATAPGRVAVRPADHIAAIVNQELVTAYEVEQRLARVREEAARARQSLPDEPELRKQVLEMLIEERAILSFARDSGVRIEDPELDRAVAGVAAQNQLTLAQLRERLRREGVEYQRFRNNLRDQMMIERVREREVQSRIKITDAEIDRLIEQQRQAAAAEPELNIAQILVAVPEGASVTAVAERRARAEAAMARVKAGESFAAVARELSEDANREKGGEIGLRPAARLPDVFVQAVANLQAGDISPPVTSRFGVHLIQVLERRVVNVDPKQLREQARNALREQKFDDAYNEWVRELRARAYVELREAPQQP